MLHGSERYRSNAADCLSDAQDACLLDHRNLHLSTAATWLSLARQDEAIENLITSWNTPKVPEPRAASFNFQGVFGCFRPPLLAPQMLQAFLQGRSSPKPARSHQQPSRAEPAEQLVKRLQNSS
jgi:hypothetical protein